MHIGVLTSGGDSPGMNAAVRTVVAAGAVRGHRITGIKNGYSGLLAGEAVDLDPAAVSGISAQGGTILGSARSTVFPTPEGQARAKAQIAEMGFEALIVVGGNGSITGGHLLSTNQACRVVGLPASIDNDVGHCGMAIGVDTAVNTIVDACDRISDTARAHKRAFIIEVMGRSCGFLAMRAGIAAEADAILYREAGLDEDALVERLRRVLRQSFSETRGYKNRVLIIKSEGVEVPTDRLVARLGAHLEEDAPGVEVRATVLGHLVRGGRPSALDRMIAQRLGYAAVLALEKGVDDAMMSWDAPGDFGMETQDRHVRIVPIPEMLVETARLLDGTSRVARRWDQMLSQVEDLLVV